MKTELSTPTAPRVLVRLGDDTVLDVPFSAVDPQDVFEGRPIRTFRSFRGQRHFSGRAWTETAGRHVVYESRLELARLMLADFDRDVTAIAAQPFRLSYHHAGRPAWHVPDFLLRHRDGRHTVVNVKPAERAAEPATAARFAALGEVFATRGWSSEVWTGSDEQLLANITFLAGYRRPALFHPADIDRTWQAARGAATVGEVEETARAAGVREARTAVLHLVWHGRIVVDLTSPLTSCTRIAL